MIEPIAPAPRIANSKSAMAVCALQRLGDVLHEPAVLRDGLRRVTLQYPPVTGDEELLEVPADVARNAGARPGEEAVDRVAAGPVYLELAAQGEAHVVGAAHGSALPGDRCVHVPYTSGRLNIATFVRRALAETLMASELGTAETPKVVAILNRILELELAGLVRYLHYSFMIFGHNRIPIV